jgi:hypothetical protein
MLERLAKLKLPQDRVGVALVLWRTAMIIAAAISAVFSYLSGMAAQSAKCAGLLWIAGQRNDPLDFWGLPFMSFLAVMFFMTGAKKGKVIELLRNYDQPVLRLGSMRITAGERVLYGILLFSLIMLGAVAATAISRYSAMAHYCGSATALQ